MGFNSGMEHHYDSMWRPSTVLPTHMLRTMRHVQETAQRAFMACLHGYGGLGDPTGWRGDQYGGPPGLPYGPQDVQPAMMDGWMPVPTRNAAAPHSYCRRDTLHEDPGRWRIDGSDRDREPVEQFRTREETWVKGTHRYLSGRSQPAEEDDTRYFPLVGISWCSTKSPGFHQLARTLPFECVAFESDAPYLPPGPRGKDRTGSPWQIYRQAELVAAEQNFPLALVLDHSNSNIASFFKFSY